MKRIVLALIGLSVMSGGGRTVILDAQQAAAPPVFRSGTRLIVENVSVKDKSGTPALRAPTMAL